jgi:two-component system, OmpR family, response regulator ChvI
MITAIENSARTSAVASMAQHASRTARPLRVVTNANLEALERLLGLGFAVQVLDADALNGPSAANIDADIVVVDRSLAGTWVPLDTQKVNAPVVFINGLASPQADYRSDVINGSIDADSSLSALKLAATFAERSKADSAEEGVTCGNLKLHNARAFWNGVDLGLTIGEYKIVELLASRPGHFFTYRAIYDRLRHEGFVAGEGPHGYWANVRSAIKRLRNKFRTFDPAFDEIENYTGFGYGWRKPG